MTTRHRPLLIFGAAVIACLLALGAWSTVRSADPAPRLLTGELWQQLSPDARIAFVWGVGNLVELEWAQTGIVGAHGKSFIPFLVRGLQGKSIDEVVRRVDDYYAAHPDQVARPVIDAIVQAVVLPALRADANGGRAR